MTTAPKTDRLVYYVQYFQRATAQEIKERLWTEFWYTPRTLVKHLPTETAALQEAERLSAAAEWREGILVREAEEPDAEGWLKPGWHVYRMELVKSTELSRVGEGALPVWLPRNEAQSFRGEKLAVAQARTNWRKAGGSAPIRVLAEAVSLRELVQRRAQTLRQEE